MPPRLLVYVLGLCNVVAGALVAFGPAWLMPGADGLGTTAAQLLGSSLGTCLAGSGVGAWLMPPQAQRPYLLVFGVGIKLVGAAIWGALAVSSDLPPLWIGALFDLGVAVLVVTGLLRHPLPAGGQGSGRLGEASLPTASRR